ncbi:MAG: HNH endonuclease [Phycisphaeraceae bacterium]|nr:HNH endonuclease [Phycisphaeraceae bacterium]
MEKRRNWTQEEMLVAFRLYCRTPFGRLHQHNPEIIKIASLIGRTPSAVAMKACNFASLDPIQRARDIKALGNTSRGDRELWDRFETEPNEVANAAEAAFERLGVERSTDDGETRQAVAPSGPTETATQVMVRRVQAFFRATVLNSYGHQCALSGIKIVELINASHIVPWHADPSRRADPRNGIALNALYDRAFDRGLMTFDESFRVVLSKRLKDGEIVEFQRRAFVPIEGRKLEMPQRFMPDPKALEYHRNTLFVGDQ